MSMFLDLTVSKYNRNKTNVNKESENRIDLKKNFSIMFSFTLLVEDHCRDFRIKHR